jgi:hypothetical protein
MSTYNIDLEPGQATILLKAFKTLDRFNWVKYIRAAGLVSASEADDLRAALHSLAKQLNGEEDGNPKEA